MTLDLTCQNCDATFDMELAELMEEEKIQCPSCDAKAPREVIDGLTGALDDLYGSLGRLHARFATTFEIDSEDLPAPFEGEEGAADDEDSDDEAGEDDDEDEDDDESRDDTSGDEEANY
jgi:hypothetical protein